MYIHVLSLSEYCVVRQWWIIQKPAGNLRKPAAEVSGRFPNSLLVQFFIKNFFVNKKVLKPAGNHGRFPTGFQRFPDNPSLTDHTVCIENNGTLVKFLTYVIIFVCKLWKQHTIDFFPCLYSFDKIRLRFLYYPTFNMTYIFQFS